MRDAAREPADFGQFAEILPRHMAEVTTTTEEAGMDILTRLIEIENAIHAMLGFVQTSVQSGPVIGAVRETLEGMEASRAVVDRMQREQAEHGLRSAHGLGRRSSSLDDAIRRIDQMYSGYVMQQRDRHAGTEETAAHAIQLF